jgi:hypothetical protein
LVLPSGQKRYVVQYRAGGRSKRMHLKAGFATLSGAKKEAKAVLGVVARGGDPLGQRRKAERTKSDTLKAIVEEYLVREAGRLRTIGERRAVLERLVLPRLGARQLTISPAPISSDCSIASTMRMGRPWPIRCWPFCAAS